MFHPFHWEVSDDFRPDIVRTRALESRFIDVNQHPVYDFAHNQFSFKFEDLTHLLEEDIVLNDPSYFVAGSVHYFAERWHDIISDKDNKVLHWIDNKVDIHDFIVPFKGNFWGRTYDHSFPPSRHFQNAPICEQFVDFINEELTNRLRSGAITYLGKVGDVEPPYLISPITIEPNKPRLCLNLQYLNCFMKDTPFSLETLSDVPRIVKRNSYMTKLDDASGYLHILMTQSSRPLLGFQWGGHYFWSNCLCFGWKNAGYVFHNTNLQVMSYLRQLSISGLLYIDDRLLEEYNGCVPASLDDPYSRACIAIKLTVKLLVSLGYYLGVRKCIFDPCQRIVFLGMIVDSVECSFFVTDKRKMKLSELRESILQRQAVPLSELQRFAGLCISMVMAIPAAKLYISCCNRAIAKASSGNSLIAIDDALREEIAYWKFLDQWEEPFPWLEDRHSVILCSSDSSDYKWGATFKDNGKEISLSDYWSEGQKDLPIMIKEALALKNTLLSLGDKIANKRLHAQCDNQAVVFSWERQYSKCAELNAIFKDIFHIIFKLKCSLTLVYVGTSQNPADAPSRALSKADARLSKRTWLFIQFLFGPHTCDMFSLDSNAMTDFKGTSLKHYTPYPTPMTDGVDAFAQVYSPVENYYAYPPFCLVPAVTRFIIQEGINCTLIFPDVKPHKSWFTLVRRFAAAVVPVGLQHDRGVIQYPSRRGFLRDKKGLKYDLLAARFLLAPKGGETTLGHVQKRETVTPVLLLGDSMVRFLEGSLSDTTVVSVGGARMQHFTSEFLSRHVSDTCPYLVLMHIGTNDVNKSMIPVQQAMHHAKMFIEPLFRSLSDLQKQFCFAVGISGCINTKSAFINTKVDALNVLLKRESMKYDFFFIDNSNIESLHLRDFVHLNDVGQRILKENFKGLI